MSNFLRRLFLYTIRYVIPYLPPRGIYFLGDALGGLMRSGPQVKIAAQELKKLFGDEKTEKELLDIARKGLANHKKDMFEIWSFPRLNSRRIKKYAFLEGKENLDRALAQGRGVVIGVSHFGSWKMIIAALAHYGYKVNQIGLDPRYFLGKERPFHHNYLMELEYKCDSSLPVNFFYIGQSMRPVFRALEANELVLNSFDGFIDKNRIETPFLNGTNKLTLGPLNLAIRTGAPLIPVFAVRHTDGRYKICIHEELEINRGLDRKEAAARAAEVYTHLFEGYVAEHPSHYCRTLYDRVVDPRR